MISGRLERTEQVAMAFCEAHLVSLSRACQAMAGRFGQGGRLLAFGRGASASDAQHVAVEFLHPVIAGKRALPALNLTAEVAWCSGLEPSEAFLRPLELLARPSDIVMALADDQGQGLLAGLARAREMGLLSLAFLGGAGTSPVGADFTFRVDCDDPLIVQEVQETAYHVLWELVHLFLDAGP